MINGPSIKNSLFKGRYIYFTVVALLLFLGITYGLVFFTKNEYLISGNITSGILDVSGTDGSISITNANPKSDYKGIDEYCKELFITNNSKTNASFRLGISKSGGDLNLDDLKVGVYVNNFKKEGTNKYQLVDIKDLSSEGDIYESAIMTGESVKTKVCLWVNEEYTGSGTEFNGNLGILTDQMDMLGTEYVSRLVDKDKGLYAIDEDGLVHTNGKIREYRYMGTDADNYVWFNCQSGHTSGNSYCEKWRIVGSILNNDGNIYNLKIVRDANLATDMVFDSTGNDYISSNVYNYLKDTYFNSLTDSAKNMITSGKYGTNATTLLRTPGQLYNDEGGQYFNIGLLSASDIGYSSGINTYNVNVNTSGLYNNSWLKNGDDYFTLTKFNDGNYVIATENNTVNRVLATGMSGIRPCVYLKSLVQIVKGNGTSDSPYELSYDDSIKTVNDLYKIGNINYYSGNNIVYVQNLFNSDNYIEKSSLTGWSIDPENSTNLYQKGDMLSPSITNLNIYDMYKINVMGTFPTVITNEKENITEIYFLKDTKTNILSSYDAATIKADVTNTSHSVGTEELQSMSNYGQVWAWLEDDTNNEGKYILKIASTDDIYLSTGYYLFNNYTNVSKIDFSNVKTDFVTDMSYMFSYAGYNSTEFSLDLSGWDTSSVTNMGAMFSDARNLKTIYVSSKWNVSNVASSTNMFSGCTNLVGGNGTVYNSGYTDVSYAHVDEDGNPGYLTLKAS